MPTGDLVGWTAAVLTVLTFSLRSMVGLRLAAVAANVCFIVYGSISGLHPVVVLHVLLIPCNLFRLFELVRDARGGGERASAAAAALPVDTPPARR
jgi:hypothetical protein